MAQVVVDPGEVAAAGARVGAVGGRSPVTAAPVGPAASDPVSLAAAATLSARQVALVGLSGMAAAIIENRAGMLADTALAYAGQEAANSAGLGRGAAVPALLGTSPVAPGLPTGQVVTPVPPPVIGPPPAEPHIIAALVHSGNPTPLHAGAANFRQQALQSAVRADDLRANAAYLEQQWNSEAGSEAVTRLRELAAWHDEHAEHAKDAALACQRAADNHGHAQATIPTPAALAAAAADKRYLPVIPPLRTDRDDLYEQALTGYARYQTATEAANLHGKPLQPPPTPRTAPAPDAERLRTQPATPAPASAAPRSAPGAARPATAASPSTNGRSGIQMLGGPRGPAPQAPGAPFPLNPQQPPPLPEPPIGKPPPRASRPPSWSSPLIPDTAKKALADLQDLNGRIQQHNGWRPDPTDPAAVQWYNEEAAYYNSWKAQLEAKLGSWNAEFTATPPAYHHSPTDGWTAPAPEPPHHLPHPGSGAPGAWGPSHENFGGISKEYQESMSGRPISEAYWVNGVKFDDYVDGKLIDYKGNYQQFVDKGLWNEPWFKMGDQEVLRWAVRQTDAAGGTPIRWVFMQKEMRDRIDSLLRGNGFSNIECVWRPMR